MIILPSYYYHISFYEKERPSLALFIFSLDPLLDIEEKCNTPNNLKILYLWQKRWKYCLILSKELCNKWGYIHQMCPPWTGCSSVTAEGLSTAIFSPHSELQQTAFK